jgi:hypothetical protein
MEPLYRTLLWLSRLAFAAMALFGTANAVLPGGSAKHLLPWDKAEHFICFYALAATGAFAFPRLPAMWLGLGLAALGGAIEVVQGLPMVARDSDWKDFVADSIAIGCALGPLVIAGWRKDWRAASDS